MVQYTIYWIKYKNNQISQLTHLMTIGQMFQTVIK